MVLPGRCFSRAVQITWLQQCLLCSAMQSVCMGYHFVYEEIRVLKMSMWQDSCLITHLVDLTEVVSYQEEASQSKDWTPLAWCFHWLNLCVLCVFHYLEDEQYLNLVIECHFYCLHYVYLPRINQSLQQFVDGWDNHQISSMQLQLQCNSNSTMDKWSTQNCWIEFHNCTGNMESS